MTGISRPKVGRFRYALLGHLLRLLGSSVAGSLLRFGSTRPLPPVSDLVRFLEALGPVNLSTAKGSKEKLLTRFPALSNVNVSNYRIMGPNLNIPVRMYQHPEKPAKEALVWVHGGAFLMGDLDMPESHWVGLMLAALGIPVVALDYVKALHGKDFRLVNRDVLTGWQWALERLQKIGISNQDVHFGGASAGANLVACVSKQLRDDEELLPASLLLMYPALHGAFPGVPTGLLKRVRTKARALCFEPDWLVDLGLHYAGYKAAESEPYAFAANGYVGGLPPTLIANCECDTLRVSGEAFACQLRDAGVAVQLHEVANTVHGSLNTPDRVEAVHMLLLMLDWIRGKR